MEADFFVRPLTCRVILGFAALHDAIPTTVGDCVDDEQHNPANGDGLQSSTNGLLVWRKADNAAAFTDGYRTWVNGPFGVQERLNTSASPGRATRVTRPWRHSLMVAAPGRHRHALGRMW